MKKTLIALVALAVTVCAQADNDEYKYLTLATTSGEQSVELATIQKITFDMNAQTVVVTTSEGVVNLPQSEMQKMFFSATPTAIAQLPLEANGLSVKRGVLTVKGNGLVRIYNASGALQQMANVEGSANISLSNLPAGTYIINMGKQTIKVNK